MGIHGGYKCVVCTVRVWCEHLLTTIRCHCSLPDVVAACRMLLLVIGVTLFLRIDIFNDIFIYSAIITIQICKIKNRKRTNCMTTCILIKVEQYYSLTHLLDFDADFNDLINSIEPSMYYSEGDFINTLDNKSCIIMSLNCQSLQAKFSQIKMLVAHLQKITHLYKFYVYKRHGLKTVI